MPVGGGLVMAFTLRAMEVEWVRLPEVPVNCTVAVALAADEDAAKLMGCDAPASSVSDEGVAVTPAGRPLMVMATVPVKPLMAVTESVTDCALPPAVRLTLEPVVLREKSGGGAVMAFTLSAMEVEWLRLPEVPVNCTVALPLAADEDAVKLMDCDAPAASVNDEGVAVTPAGRPLMAMAMVPVKPLMAVTESVTDCALPPALRLTAEPVVLREKSGLRPAMEVWPQPTLHRARSAKIEVSAN